MTWSVRFAGNDFEIPEISYPSKRFDCPDEMGKICLMVVIGGIWAIYGPLMGTFFVVILSELIRGWAAEFSLLIFALAMILTVRFVRGGFMEIVQAFLPGPRKSRPA